MIKFEAMLKPGSKETANRCISYVMFRVPLQGCPINYQGKFVSL
jgi:hypothetical protein